MNKKILFALLSIAFIVYLISANSIALLFIPSEQKVEKYSFDVHPQDGFYGALTAENYAVNAAEKAYFAGWSFTGAQHGQDTKEVRMLFRGDKISYRSQPAILGENKAVIKLFDDDIAKQNQAFSLNVSTLGIKNGDYSTFIEITENDGTSCIMPTGRSFRKEGIAFNEITVSAERAQPQEAVEEVGIDFFVTPITENDIGIFIDGWAYLPQADSTKQQMYAELVLADGTIKWYTLIPTDSLDNASINKDIGTIRSAFKATIPREELQAGDMLLRIVIGNEKDGYKKSKIAAGYSYTK